MATVQNKDIVNLLIEHEEALALLFSKFREAIPEMEEFWERLMQDECAHAEVLRMLLKTLESGRTSLNKRKFNSVAVRTTIGYIEQLIATVHTSQITSIRALSLAFDSESSSLERDFFEVFESDSEDMKREFLELRANEDKHREAIEERLRIEIEKVENRGKESTYQL
jgi:hypothetical protein